MLPDIDSIALFVRAAHLHSLTKAAEASNVGLAAASRRIALLEHRLKANLFERSPRGVELTPAGHTLLVHAKALLTQMNQLQADMADHTAGRRGQLRVLANTSAMTQALPEALARFSQAHPDIGLVVGERWSPDIVRAVLAGEADLGVVMDGVSTEGLDIFEYCTDVLAVVTPADHPLTQCPMSRFTDVLDHDLIALESGASMMRLVTEQAVSLQKTLRLRVQVRSFEALCRMVQAGMGVGLLPFESASELGKSMGLAVRPLNETWAARRMLLCIKKDRVRSTALEALLAVLQSAGDTDFSASKTDISDLELPDINDPGATRVSLVWSTR